VGHRRVATCLANAHVDAHATELHLGCHLTFHEAAKRSCPEVRLDLVTVLVDVLRQLRIPQDEVGLAAVNRELVRVGTGLAGDLVVSAASPQPPSTPRARATIAWACSITGLSTIRPST